MLRNKVYERNFSGRFSNNDGSAISPARRRHQPVSIADLFKGLRGDYTFLADEDIPPSEIDILRCRFDYRVRSVAEEFSGSGDEDVLAVAASEELVLLGCDKGYGKLIYRDGHPPPLGGILFRNQPKNIADLTLWTLQSGIAIEGNYIVVKLGQTPPRHRPLPFRSDGRARMMLIEPPRPPIITLESPKPTGSSSSR